MISKRENQKNIREILERMARQTKYESCGKDCKTRKTGIEHSLRCKLHVTEGSRWQEVDKRFLRIVEVIKIVGDKVHIQCIMNNAGPLVQDAYNRVTVASLKRFNGKSKGYRILGMRCHECQLAAGAVVPKGGHQGITVSLGRCGACLKDDSTLVPSSDYHWPKEGRRAILD